MAHYNHFAVFKKIDEQMKGEKRPAEVSRRLAFGIEGQEQKNAISKGFDIIGCLKVWKIL